MGLPKSLQSYNDVAPILAQALLAGGANYYLPTKGAAHRWAARAYQYRKLLQSGEPGDFSLAHLIIRAPVEAPGKGWLLRIEPRKVEGLLEVDQNTVQVSEDELTVIRELGGDL